MRPTAEDAVRDSRGDPLEELGIAAVRRAAERIADYVHRTPVLSSRLLDQAAGCRLYFKCENLQRAGAFKARGAHNALLALDVRSRARGVATHSSGNHAAALALAAQTLGTTAHIVMPATASRIKVDAVRAYGGRIRFCEATQSAREAALADLCRESGAVFIPPYDHPDVVAGQGTCVLELAGQLDSPPDILLAPVGGGGLLAGSAVAAANLWPDTVVLGAEPAGADDARRSLHGGERQPQTAPDTIADGLRTGLGELTFPLIQRHVRDILCADDGAIVAAMRLLWSRMKLLVEPSAAVTLAAVLAHPEIFAHKRVAVVLSGGNVDLDNLPW